MKVLHLIYDDPQNPWVAGGGAVRVREIYRRLVDRLESVTVATGAFPGAQDREIVGIRYLRLGAPSPYVWSRTSYTLKATRLLRSDSYDAAVFDFSTYVPLGLPGNRPVGVTVHHVTGESASERWGPYLGRIVSAQERFRLRTARVFSATSGATESRLREIVGPDARIFRVGAGVPDELFELTRTEADYLLYFGRLDWVQKGLDTLLESMRILVRRHPDLRLKVAGRGRDAGRFESAARELRLSGNVEILGPVDDVRRNELFAGARALLMPSRFEGFGMVAAEAMAAGVPVIASEAGSLPEVVAPPSGGILAPAGDPASFAAAVERLLEDDALRARIGRTARRSAERFRWATVADRHLEFLTGIAAGSPSPDNRLHGT